MYIHIHTCIHSIYIYICIYTYVYMHVCIIVIFIISIILSIIITINIIILIRQTSTVHDGRPLSDSEGIRPARRAGRIAQRRRVIGV